jgi:uncharacterized coiled-coil protein SlyX
MDEETRTDELAARIEALEDRLGVVEDALRYVFQRLVEAEGAVLQTHERLATAEAAWEKARDLLKLVSEAVEVLARRAAGGRPPSAPPPLSGVN